jgi:hypothetical protein
VRPTAGERWRREHLHLLALVNRALLDLIDKVGHARLERRHRLGAGHAVEEERHLQRQSS